MTGIYFRTHFQPLAMYATRMTEAAEPQATHASGGRSQSKSDIFRDDNGGVN